MLVRHNCPTCPTALIAATELTVGQRIRCPKCSAVFTPVSAMFAKSLPSWKRTWRTSSARGMPASKVQSLTSFIVFGEGLVELIVVHANTAVTAADLMSGIQLSNRKHEKNVRIEVANTIKALLRK